MRLDELLLYRDFEKTELIDELTAIIENCSDEMSELADLRVLAFDFMHKLIDYAGQHGFYGNLWHCFIADMLASHENSYSIGCEVRGGMEGSINDIALNDFEIIREYLSYDFSELISRLSIPAFGILLDYKKDDAAGHIYNSRIRDAICALAGELGKAGSAEEIKSLMENFYKNFGVGKLGLHKAFRISHDENTAVIEPIKKIAHVKLSDLVGYEIPKQKLVENTEAFLEGKKANNCLLYGDAGTGKSSSIKAISNEYYDRGLRIIEVYRHQFKDLHSIISQIKNRNYRFILYMDDLSFEDFETEYKYLKAVIEGGLEQKPENVLIYATSNRRHLVRERHSDKREILDDLHENDTVQEKLSLSSRFGVSIYFGKPEKKEFQEIIRVLAKREGITLSEEELMQKANAWELSHGGRSGRTARQFIDNLSSKI